MQEKGEGGGGGGGGGKFRMMITMHDDVMEIVCCAALCPCLKETWAPSTIALNLFLCLASPRLVSSCNARRRVCADVAAIVFASSEDHYRRSCCESIYRTFLLADFSSHFFCLCLCLRRQKIATIICYARDAQPHTHTRTHTHRHKLKPVLSLK